jgi:hypothetical protein
MKSKKEIEQLGKQSAQKKYRLQHIPLEQIDEYGGEIKDYVTIFIHGYTQCQEDNADKIIKLEEKLKLIEHIADEMAKDLIEQSEFFVGWLNESVSKYYNYKQSLNKQE